MRQIRSMGQGSDRDWPTGAQRTPASSSRAGIDRCQELPEEEDFGMSAHSPDHLYILTYAHLQIQLDHLGNLPNATEPVPEVKRTNIVVHRLWYDGEDPPVVAAPASKAVATNAAGSRRGKK
jgi:hypothetical protein